jgi:hypothetical protein
VTKHRKAFSHRGRSRFVFNEDDNLFDMRIGGVTPNTFEELAAARGVGVSVEPYHEDHRYLPF